VSSLFEIQPTFVPNIIPLVRHLDLHPTTLGFQDLALDTVMGVEVSKYQMVNSF
jgi:hypothetical protein